MERQATGQLGSNVNSQKEEDFNLIEGDAPKEVVDVRFQDDNEYLTAILGGLWAIFGHYLMVRSWTLGFSTDQAQPTNLMVWIRVPGLPEGILLCQIKIDRTQQLEYEFLPMGTVPITESDQPQRRVLGIQKNIEEDRHIPWMLVERKQRRGPRPVAAKSVRVTVAGETSCFGIFGGNLGDAIRINAQESNVGDVSQMVTTQIGGVSGTTTGGCFG
ncbi:hypothetical protein PVK06_048126 [Gossypium arboreum]|uniref:DUF4283 domain-containing protein n=1 Tax=Gossypium arboreum TaxID=29729 RepID=A0ABR0MH29_GOSAR|nr:hypothetical protein PVK06_048126 [Gossypium arboreum]